MEVIKRKDGTLRYREKVYIGGKAVSKCFLRKTDADAWKRRMRAEEDRLVALGIERQRQDPFRDFVIRWKAHQDDLLAPSSKRSYYGIIDSHLAPFLGEKCLHEISRGTASNLVAALKGAGKTASGIDRVMSLLKGMLNDAVDWELIPSNPLNRFPKQGKRMARDVFWSESEVNQFLQANQEDPLFPLYVVALNTGMRRGELCGLKWDRVDFERNLIEVCRTRDRDGLREKTKTNRPRCIYMNQEVRRALMALWKQPRGEFVFLGKRAAPIDVQHVYRAFEQAQERAKNGQSDSLPFPQAHVCFALRHEKRRKHVRPKGDAGPYGYQHDHAIFSYRQRAPCKGNGACFFQPKWGQ
jgi:integrase